mmetsp:Transcript_31044/g.83369  ORF Transcript_31044/g.83369 Transcript_31044/m.83369 type:complete len:391 (-) Transcript_31044:332-1504(-)
MAVRIHEGDWDEACIEVDHGKRSTAITLSRAHYSSLDMGLPLFPLPESARLESSIWRTESETFLASASVSCFFAVQSASTTVAPTDASSTWDGAGEEVFVSQLARRASLLDSTFQRSVYEVLSRHAISKVSLSGKEPIVSSSSSNASEEGDTNTGLSVSRNMPDGGNHVRAENHNNHNNHSAKARWEDGAGEGSVSDAHENQSENSQPKDANPAANGLDSKDPPPIVRLQYWFKRSDGRSPADGGERGAEEHPHRSNSHDSDGWRDWVELRQAKPKKTSRMLEKLRKYSPPHPRAHWPLAANILDPVRCSIICNGASAMLQVHRWFADRQDKSSIPICRIKNKFSLGENVPGGYRDLQLSVLVEGERGLRIIGEIQVAACCIVLVIAVIT